MIKLISIISYYTGLTKIFFFLNRNRKKIISFHNIIPDHLFDDTLHLGVSTHESSFNVQVNYLKEKFRIDTDLKNNQTVTITFDDGYLNQYQAIKKHFFLAKVPAVLFCTLKPVQTGTASVTDLLLYWFSYSGIKKSMITINNLEIEIETVTPEGTSKTWSEIFKFLCSGDVKQEELFDELSKLKSFDEILKTAPSELSKIRLTPLTREQIHHLRSNQIEVEAHGYNHEILSTHDEKEFQALLDKIKVESEDLFESKIFCYPFGGIQEVKNQTKSAVKNSGWKFAVSNINNPQAIVNYDQHFIPRLALSDTKSIKVIEFELSGLKHFLKYKKLFPKW